MKYRMFQKQKYGWLCESLVPRFCLNLNRTWPHIKATCLSKDVVPRSLNIEHSLPPTANVAWEGTSEVTIWLWATVLHRHLCLRLQGCHLRAVLNVSLKSCREFEGFQQNINPPPGFQYNRCLHEAGNIVSDPLHPLHRLFDPLPSGGRCRSIRARTTRMLNSFLPQPIGLLNNNSIILIICRNNRPKCRHFLTSAAYCHITLSLYSAMFVFIISRNSP